MGDFVSTFREKLPSSSCRSRVNSSIHNTEEKGGNSLNISKENYTTTRCNKPEDLLPQYKVRFTDVIIFKPDVISGW
jgi:hypothetical protein